MEEYQIQQSITVDFARTGAPPVVYAKQGDSNMRIVCVRLLADGQPYTVPEGYSVNVRLLKPDGTHVYNPALGIEENTALVVLTQQMLAIPGNLTAEIEVVKGADQPKSATWYIACEPSAVPEDSIESTDEYKTITELAQITLEAQAAATAAENAAEQAAAWAEQKAATALEKAQAAEEAAAAAEEAQIRAQTAEEAAAESQAAAEEAEAQAQAQAETAEEAEAQAKAWAEKAFSVGRVTLTVNTQDGGLDATVADESEVNNA